MAQSIGRFAHKHPLAVMAHKPTVPKKGGDPLAALMNAEAAQGAPPPAKAAPPPMPAAPPAAAAPAPQPADAGPAPAPMGGMSGG